MWEFMLKLAAVTVAVNVTIVWAAVVISGLRRPQNPWPQRENLS